MLTLCEPSPPVPTMSMAPSGASTCSIFSRIVATAPEISSTVSPRTRSAIRKRADLAGRRFAGHDDVERRARLVEGERLAGRDLGDMGFQVAHRAVRKPAPAGSRSGRRSTSYSLCSRATSWSSRSSRKPGGEGLARVLRHGVRPGAGRLEHFGHLEQDAGRRRRATAITPVPPSATPKIAATPGLPKSASSASRFRPRLVCFSSLSSAASVSSGVPSFSRFSQLGRLGVEPLLGFGRLPVGDDLGLAPRRACGRAPG